MASLVAPLAAGIAAAPSGSVLFVRQGTATPATVYSDPEGATVVTTHTLDAYGSIVRYVEERVDVTVLNVAAATVRSFTWGTDARDARVENLGFNGTLPLGGTGAGGMTTVDAVLTKAYQSFGGLDWKVDVNGTPTTIATAIAGSAGLVYNVTTAPYNATGDGVTNDSSAVQAALNAATAAGGGIVYFPTGTYLLNSGVSIGAGESLLTLLGDSSRGSILKQGVSGTTMLSLGDNNTTLVQGLQFTGTLANTGVLVEVGSASRTNFVSCSFGSIDGILLALADWTETYVNCYGCIFAQAGGSSCRMVADPDAAGGEPLVNMFGCRLVTASDGMTTFSNCRVGLYGCSIVLGAAIAAGTTILVATSSQVQIVGGDIDCDFTSGTVSLGTDVNLSIVGAKVLSSTTLNLCGTGTNTLHEAGCNLDTTVFLGTFASGSSSSRDHRRTATSGTAITYTPNGEYMIHEVTSASTTVSMAFQDPSPAVPPGHGLLIIWKNNSGIALTPTFPGSAYTNLVAPVSIDSGKSAIFYFVPKGSTISTDLIGIGPQPATGVTL